MFFDIQVGQAHANSIVIKEDDDITTPVLQDGVDELQRQPLVTPRVNKELGCCVLPFLTFM
jgi:hypothetical protein